MSTFQLFGALVTLAALAAYLNYRSLRLVVFSVLAQGLTLGRLARRIARR